MKKQINKHLPIKDYLKIYVLIICGMLFLWFMEQLTITRSTAGYTPARYWIGIVAGIVSLVLVTISLVMQTYYKNKTKVDEEMDK